MVLGDGGRDDLPRGRRPRLAADMQEIDPFGAGSASSKAAFNKGAVETLRNSIERCLGVVVA